MFASTPVYVQADGVVVFGLRLPAVLPANGDMQTPVTQVQQNRMDLISQTLYGRPDAWWAIADCSNVIDVLAEVLADTTLRAPQVARLPA